MIKELSELGLKKLSNGKYPQWNNVALKEEPVSTELIIDTQGNFCRFQIFEKMSTIAEALTSKKGKARLLLDKAEEVLRYGDNSLSKHQLFLEKLNRFRDILVLNPIFAFYEENKFNGIEKAAQEFEIQIPDPKNRKGNIAFRIQGMSNRIHEEPDVLNGIIKRYKETYKPELTCSICGKEDYPVEDIPHGMIKKVPDGQPSGCALVSYNEKAFESYGLIGNNNSSICTNCAKTYVEGLNWLLSNGNEYVEITKKGKEKKTFRYTNRKNFGTDTAMVFWTREDKVLKEIDTIEKPSEEEVAALIDSVAAGTKNYLDPDYFYSCTLSGSASRIFIRDWIEVNLFDFKKSIARWFKDIAIGEYTKDEGIKTHYARLYNLARSCQRINSDGSLDDKDTSWSRAAVHLWNSALKNSSVPLWILTKVLQRARVDKNGVTADRAALIKLILNRHKGGGDFMIKEEIQKDNRSTAYVCGQIFAKMESIQYYALKERNAGIKEKFFTFAMTSPASAFGRLFNLNSKHFTKLKSDKPGLAVNLDKELQELCMGIRSFPSIFSLVEQGQFAIGYYHQKQAQFSSTKNNEEE
ncbi:MAG: type I-C CRISPR-associated protein Cas8c/Csd1 [Nitrospirae bacterium]|nr:type I-C CRISPR-associated protein Cas8c/Csd1 [Nitrospirota bacterium]